MTTDAVRSGVWARLARLAMFLTTGPAYTAEPADLRTVRVVGLALPTRETVALLVVTAVLVADATGLAFRPIVLALSAPIGGLSDTLARGAERFVLFGLVPLGVVVLGFRDGPARYGLTLGIWRVGLPLLLVGLAIMTPIIASLATQPAFIAYYGHPATSVAEVGLANGLEVFAAEFLLRGFLLFTLLRRVGPVGLFIALVPFVLTHVGKPDVELWSTFIGGSVFAWLDWRTRSIVWSALGHLYVLTLMIVVATGLAAAR